MHAPLISCNAFFRVCRPFITFGILLLCALASIAAAAQSPAVLNDPNAIVELWPAVTILRDPDAKFTIAEAASAPEKFILPQSAYATLGLREKVVWLRVPLTVAASAATPPSAQVNDQWILDIDYALLNRIDVYLLADGKIQQQTLLGNALPLAERPLRSRSHATPLDLRPGVNYTLIVRVDTIGAMILPITLSRLSAFHGRAIDEQLLQGLVISIGVCLLLYSLLQWSSLREALYLKYSLQVVGSLFFAIHFFGIGELYLWTDNMWFERHMAGITTLVAVCGTALFVEDALAQDMGPRLRFTMKLIAAVLAVVAILHAIDWLDIYGVSIVLSTLGLLPALLGIPGAVARLRRHDSVGALFLVAWLVYFVARAVTLGFVTGHLGANFWSMHLSQFGAAIDMLIFMRIAVLRSTALHQAAQRATRERDVLHSLAHTDPLTKLLNRRGLHTTLTAALHNSTPEKLLAVYVLDLDGFKRVNDQYGHDAGDELLETVASRLLASMRTGDVIARIGGDEFVVLAAGLQTDQQAIELGNKLLTAIREPYALSRQTCHVGVTIGYVLAPLDGPDATNLLKLADAAMYVGKQAGKGRLQRGVAAQASHISSPAEALP